jgi:hypothetical protein
MSLPLCYEACVIVFYFFHFLSIGVSSRIRTLDLGTMSQVFYHCAAGHKYLLFDILSLPKPVAGFDPWILGL